MASAAAFAAITVRAAAAAQVFVDDPAHPELADDDVHHLGRVLRLRPGEEVVAADGHGRWARTTWSGGSALEMLAARAPASAGTARCSSSRGTSRR